MRNPSFEIRNPDKGTKTKSIHKINNFVESINTQSIPAGLANSIFGA